MERRRARTAGAARLAHDDREGRQRGAGSAVTRGNHDARVRYHVRSGGGTGDLPGGDVEGCPGRIVLHAEGDAHARGGSSLGRKGIGRTDGSRRGRRPGYRDTRPGSGAFRHADGEGRERHAPHAVPDGDYDVRVVADVRGRGRTGEPPGGFAEGGPDRLVHDGERQRVTRRAARLRCEDVTLADDGGGRRRAGNGGRKLGR